MADFIKKPSIKKKKVKGLASYAKKDNKEPTFCEGCGHKPLTEAELLYCAEKGIPDLCYNCQRKEGYVKDYEKDLGE